MASESNARSLESSDSNQNRIELDGLERFFEDDHRELFDKGLSIKQAVYYYGDTRKSLKAKVLQGLIPAIRLPEAFGKKWRVFPDGVPPQLEHLIPKKLKSSSNFVEDDDLSLADDDEDDEKIMPPAEVAEPKPEPSVASSVKTKKSKPRKPKQAKSAQDETIDFSPPEQALTQQPILDFSVPGIDRPGQLILQAAGFWVEDIPLTADSISSTQIFPEAEVSTTDDALLWQRLDEKIEPTVEDITASALANLLLRTDSPEIELPFLETQIIPAELQLVTATPPDEQHKHAAPVLGQTIGLVTENGLSHNAAKAQIHVNVTGLALIITAEGLCVAGTTTLIRAENLTPAAQLAAGFCISEDATPSSHFSLSHAKPNYSHRPSIISVEEYSKDESLSDLSSSSSGQALPIPPTEPSFAEFELKIPETTSGSESTFSLESAAENSIMELVGEAVYGARARKQLRKKEASLPRPIMHPESLTEEAFLQTSAAQPIMPVAPPFPEILLRLQDKDIPGEQTTDLLAASALPSPLLADQIARLEKQLNDANYKNGYLETRVSALEDQIKFLTRSHYHNRSFNVMLLVIPALVLATLFVVRFYSIGTL
jgi:hypothetical protein